MNTTIDQILQLDSYLRAQQGNVAQVPNADGEIFFATMDINGEGAVLLLNPNTGKCRIRGLSSGAQAVGLTEEQTIIALATTFTTLFNAARTHVENQHRVAAQFARDRAIEMATKRAVGLPS